MSGGYQLVLDDPVIIGELGRAWDDFLSGLPGSHEEGGFIIRVVAGGLAVIRWPQGKANAIDLPPHPNCTAEEGPILATFHTHPNAGHEYLQEPSETDRRAVRDDPDLKGEGYVGEFVLAARVTYLIAPDGKGHEVARTPELLARR